MKLLLTSAGIKNASIHDALELLGKPIADSVPCIPTAGYGHPMGTQAWRFIAGKEPRTPM
jgi:dipeptidase E